MKRPPFPTCLFVDIGGVLLSDGWDKAARAFAAQTFHLDPDELEERHHLTFESFEIGKLTLAQYLNLVVFDRPREFTAAQFRTFMFDRSTAHVDMIGLTTRLKARYGLRVVVVSNEARELNAYRIRQFHLGRLADFFISSCFVGLRKPDPAIFRLALDLAQVRASRVVYLENTPMFVQIAEELGITGILHTDFASTRTQLAALGLSEEGR